MSCISQLSRIPINRRCDGYYMRWYYNGWHYWLFYPGKINFVTEGEKYRTLGTQKLTIGSGQITQEQCDAIRTIMNATEISLYTDSGWGVVRIDPGSWIVYDHGLNRYEAEINVTIGSKYISRSGFSPAITVPILPPSIYVPTCGVVTIGTQTWMTCNYDINYPGSKVYNNDENNRALYGGLYSYNQIITPGFVPYGWHIPSVAEWITLMNTVGTALNAGGKLKEIGTTRWTTPNTGAVDTYGFAMVGNGFYFAGTFWELKNTANLWASDGIVKVSYDSAEITINSFAFIIPTAYIGVRLIADTVVLLPPVATAGTVVGNNWITANWNASTGATGYRLDVSTNAAFSSFVTGFNNKDVGNVTTYNVLSLAPNTTYYYRLRAYNITAISSNSNVISAITYDAMVISSRGDGSGVAQINVTVSAGCVLTLDGAARFYSDAAGTLNESTTWTPIVGALRIRYIKCPSGTSNLTMNDVGKLLTFGNANSSTTATPAWNYTGAITNIPSLNCSQWNYPNCTNIGLYYTTITTFNNSVTKLSTAFVKGCFAGGGTISGNTSQIPATCKILGCVTSTISGNISALPAVMEQLYLTTGNTLTGALSGLPASMTYLNVAGSNTISGDIADLPAGITLFTLTGSNTITGDIADFSASMQRVSVIGTNTLSGDIGDLKAAMYQIAVYGNNTISGDLVNLPTTVNAITIAGANTITGGFTALSGVTLRTIDIGGSNTISGDLADLPAGITSISITGNNTVNGSLGAIPASLIVLVITGSNTISGNIDALPAGLIILNITGVNTISGDIGNIPTGLTLITIYGSNTISDYSGKTWTETGYILTNNPVSGGLSAAEIDQLLIDIDSCAFTRAGYKSIILKGTHAAPTATSLAARNSLIAKGVTLNVN